jgi:hypothetical protein
VEINSSISKLWPAYNVNAAPLQAPTEVLFQQTRLLSTSSVDVSSKAPDVERGCIIRTLVIRSPIAAPSINVRPVAASNAGRTRGSFARQVHICIPDAFADGTGSPSILTAKIASPVRCPK